MVNRHVPLPAALSGLASVALLFAGQAVGGGGSPDLNASRGELASWLAKQHGTSAGYAGAMLELLAILALIVFAATLWSVLRRADSEDGIASATVFGAGLVSATIKLASAPAAFAALWRAPQGIDPQLASALLDMNNASFVLTWAIDAVMLGAAAFVILRSRVLPHWLGWFGAVAATLSIVTVPVAAHAPPFGILLTFVWLVATSIVLARRPRVAAAVATA